jgi:hypothetical protein
MGAGCRRAVLPFCRIGTALILTLQLACYRYVPATIETLPDQASVRVVLSPAAQEQLHATYGVTTAGPALSAKLVGRPADSVALYLPSVPMGTGPGTRPLYQQVGVARADVLRVDLRQVDAFRTGVLAALAAGAVSLAAYHAIRGEQSVVTPPPPPPPAEGRRGWKIGVFLSWP